MTSFATSADLQAPSRPRPPGPTAAWPARCMSSSTARRDAMVRARRSAISCCPGPEDKAVTLTWAQLQRQVDAGREPVPQPRRRRNGRRGLCPAERAGNGGHTAGRRGGGDRQPDQPAAGTRTDRAILRETKAKVVVTLKAFPKTDLAQKVAEAVRLAPNVKTVLEVDLCRYLTPPKKLDRAADPARRTRSSTAPTSSDFAAETGAQARRPADLHRPARRPGRRLFPHRRHDGDAQGGAAQGRGMVYNGWLGATAAVQATEW